MPMCKVPDDQIAKKSYPLFAARGILNMVIREYKVGHQTS